MKSYQPWPNCNLIVWSAALWYRCLGTDPVLY